MCPVVMISSSCCVACSCMCPVVMGSSFCCVACSYMHPVVMGSSSCCVACSYMYPVVMDSSSLLCVATHDTIGRTIHHNGTHGRIHGGMSLKLERTDGRTAVLSPILESPEDEQYWSKLVVCIYQSYKRDFNV
jgi:hypothetical protein